MFTKQGRKRDRPWFWAKGDVGQHIGPVLMQSGRKDEPRRSSDAGLLTQNPQMKRLGLQTRFRQNLANGLRIILGKRLFGQHTALVAVKD